MEKRHMARLLPVYPVKPVTYSECLKHALLPVSRISLAALQFKWKFLQFYFTKMQKRGNVNFISNVEVHVNFIGWSRAYIKVVCLGKCTG